ncbi:MAG: Ldh family oxidoreductase [Albidovulum sp.]|nr:Ldh family oxidoreductase [Albidovulum sp.]MDE0529971.1 Ldh family oxidoreductase [Albidovulum sp.]
MHDALRIDCDALTLFLTNMFRRLGMAVGNAEICADDIVLTNLWGIDSHGVLRLPIYAQRLRKNVIKGNPNIRLLADAGAMRILDGDAGMGFLVGHHAMSHAIELAERCGIGAVSVTNSNHFGAASLYTSQAARAGYMAIAMTNVQPNLVAPGGSRPITGNNPIAFGAPTRLGFPFLLDISMSTVAGGKLHLAIEKGERIPLGWATDGKGCPTEDPTAALEGYLLPLGGHKGFGLSLVVDLLCGVINGGAFQHQIRSMYAKPNDSSGTGHMMIALNPGLLLDENSYFDRMDQFYCTIKSSPLSNSDAKMYLPGEIEHETRERRRAEGIPLPSTLLEKINGLASQLNVAPLAATGRC